MRVVKKDVGRGPETEVQLGVALQKIQFGILFLCTMRWRLQLPTLKLANAF